MTPIRMEGTAGPAAPELGVTPAQARHDQAAAVALAHAGARAVSSGPGAPIDAAALGRVAALGDPLALLMKAQSDVRNRMGETQRSRIDEKQTQAEHAELARKKALESAIKAAKKGGFTDRLTKALKGIAVAVAAAATAVTGGAAAGLLIAGTVLAVTGDKIAQGLHKAGLIDEKTAAGLGMGLQLVGAAMGMAGAGMATAGASVAQGVAQFQEAARLVNAGVQVAQGGSQMAGATFQHQHAGHMTDAAAQKLQVDGATDSMEQAVEILRESFEQFERASAHLMEAAEARQQAQYAASRMLA